MNDPLPSGVRVSRRIVLHGGLAATALGALSRLGDPSRPRRDDVAAFLQRWTDRSAELVAAERPNEDAHLLALCAGLAELEPAAFPKRMRTTWDEGGMKSGPAHVAMPFLIVRFDLEPGVVIPAHNHVGYAFVSMGVAGEATVRHFEPEGAAPPPDDLRTGFRIRETQRRVLTAGRTTTLSRTRDNIHCFRAGENGATFLDFGIKFPDPGAGPKITSSLQFDDEPVDAARRVHTAKWLGNIYAK
ncbi:MAG: hypothetical protein KAI24_10640 [Planctomycetes bacterium]|nr:hypothetical protein [Planctomycetota bacterium]